MRILHYRATFSELSETFIYDLLLALEQQHLENHVITLRHINTQTRPFPHLTLVSPPGKWDLERFLKKYWGRYVLQNHPLPTWKITQKKVKKEVQAIRPDIIHSHLGRGGVFMSKIANDLHIPHIVSFHGQDAFQLPNEKVWRQQFDMLNQQNTIITCVSQYMKQHLSQIFAEDKIKVIHVGKAVEDYPFQPPEGEIQNWLSIGRLTEKKGHEDTINAFSQIVGKYPNQKLKIIGAGEQKQKLQKLIKALKMDKHIFLLGALPHEKVKKELFHADAFILSSKTAKDGDKEGIPTVLMEAEAVGKPCISTTHSGIPEVFPSSYQSFLAEEGHVEDIVQKIEKLLCLPVEVLKEISIAGRKKIETDFNLETETQKLIQIYRSTLASFL